MNLFVIEEEKNIDFNELTDEILKLQPHPEDKYEIAALLESLGWNDELAAETFGAEDVFALAANILDNIERSLLIRTAGPARKISLLNYYLLLVKSFLRGTIFALPMAVSILSMLTLRFSLWSYQYLSLEDATSIAIATIISFMAVGGFTQAIAHRGFMYVGQGHYFIARKVSFYLAKSGYYFCLIIATVFLLFSTFFSVFSWHMTMVIFLYFFFLSGIWLSVTIMYILQKEIVFTGIITGGILIVFILFEFVKLNIILSQIIALSVAALAGIILTQYLFRRKEKEMEAEIMPTMPRLSILVYTSIPYFAYGFLYFTFLFVDRIIAWSTNDIYMPYLIWFRGEYELGLDFALLVLILPMGLIEVFVNEMMANLEASQKNCLAGNTKQLGKEYLSFYRKRIVYIVVFLLINAITLFFAVRFLGQVPFLEADIFSSRISTFVFGWALAAYVFVGVALMNALILFCMAQPEMVYRSIFYSLVINVLVGFMLSRWVNYSLAVIGLFAGAAAFSFLTGRYVLKVLNNLDYYLYSAT